MFQRTLSRAVKIEGIGLHSGNLAKVEIHPARPNTGIIFSRADLAGSPEIKASFRNVVSTQLATTLGVRDVTISTVEHLMAAFQGCGIDNAYVEVFGPELPILDGSSREFCRQFKKAGIENQILPRQKLQILRRVEVRLGEKWAAAEPGQGFELNVSIEWDHPVIGFQSMKYRQGQNDFSEIEAARTFGFIREVEALKKMGLARGGSLDNAIVLDDAGVLNPDGLRYSDEFIRHKVLDALGDLKLAGFEIEGQLRFHRGGHDMHSRLIAEIFKDPANYRIVSDVSENDEDLAQASLVPAAV